MKFGEKLLHLRREKGLSQEALAERVGTTRQAVSKWENGQGYPETEKVLRLAELFGVSADFLLREDSSVPRPDTPGYYVSRETARGFLAAEAREGWYVGLGFLCLALAGAPWALWPTGSAGRLAGMGVCIVLAICAWVYAAMIGSDDYAVLRREPLVFDRGVLQELQAEAGQMARRWRRVFLPSAVLWIAGLICLSLLRRSDLEQTAGGALTFLALGVGLFGFAVSAGRLDSYALLTRNEVYCGGLWFRLRRWARRRFDRFE